MEWRNDATEAPANLSQFIVIFSEILPFWQKKNAAPELGAAS